MALQSESRGKILKIVQKVLGAGSARDTLHFFLHWLELNHMTPLAAREVWKVWSLCVHRRTLNTSVAGN